MWTKNEISQALLNQAKKPSPDLLFLQNNTKEQIFNEIFIDSRKATTNGLFVALKGERNDGHDYLIQAFANGAVAAIVEKIPSELANSNPDLCSNLLLVENSYQALNQIAQFARSRSRAKIIAITGSVGKTSTKEMLKMAFATQGKTFATSGNLNNHIGLPLSLCNLAPDCEYGIFEIGMNHLHEIEPLTKILRPHLAAITNVGPVHIEFFKDEQEIALAKSEIFCGLSEQGIALINCDIQQFDFLFSQAKKLGINEGNIATFGSLTSKQPHRHYQLIESKIISKDVAAARVKLANGNIVSYELGVINQGQIFNSLIVAASLDILGKNIETGLSSLKNFHQTSGRGAVIEVEFCGKKISIIDDAYNASILSVKAGLIHAQNLKEILQKNRLVCAIGDMLELGINSSKIHAQAIVALSSIKCDFAILVGDEISKAYLEIASVNGVVALLNHSSNAYPILANSSSDDEIAEADQNNSRIAEKNSKINFGALNELASSKTKNLSENENHPIKNFMQFKNSLDAAAAIKDILKDGDLLYIKGSRGMKMERLIEALKS